MKSKIMKKIRRKILAAVLAVSIAAGTMGGAVLKDNNTVQTQAAKKKLTKKQARAKVVKYLKQKKKWKKSYYLDYDHKEGNIYLFHYYEKMPDHTATVNWYEVNIKTGKITAMF